MKKEVEDWLVPTATDRPVLHHSSNLLLRDLIDWNSPLSWFLPIIEAPPFTGQVHLKRFSENLEGRAINSAVAVPVRNEFRLLPRCLSGLRAAADQLVGGPAFIFVVHDTEDRSYEIIRNWLLENNLAGTVLDLRLTPQIRNAPHARRLALDIAARLCPEGTLFTTDADSCVGAQWFRQSMKRMESGCDLVCEDVMLFDEELAQLPAQVRLVGDAERAYFEISEKLWQEWTGGACGAFAHRASGASMAFRSAVYTKLDGLPVPSVGEDGAFCAAVVDAGYNVITLPNYGTRTSARLHARAIGGCGYTLNERSLMEDPTCDARLVPVSDLRRRSSSSLAVKHVDAEKAYPPKSVTGQFRRPLRYSELQIELGHGRKLLVNLDENRVG